MNQDQTLTPEQFRVLLYWLRLEAKVEEVVVTQEVTRVYNDLIDRLMKQS